MTLSDAINKNEAYECSIENGYCQYNTAEQWNQILAAQDTELFDQLKELIYFLPLFL